MADVRKLLRSLLFTLLSLKVSGQSPNLTSTSDIVCFGEEVTLTCSAEVTVRWLSNVIGEEMSIQFFRLSDSPGDIFTRGNATAEYLRAEGNTVTSSLKFNATYDVSMITCRDSGANSMSKNITVSSRPSNDSPIMDMSVNNNNTARIVTWGQPSNNEDFILESYTVTLRNSSGDIVDGPTTLPPSNESIRYDELQTGTYSFNLTMISSCGDAASRIHEFQVSEPITESTESTESTSEPASGESDDNSSTLPTWVYVAAPILLVIIIVVVVVVVVVVVKICFSKGKNKGETKAPGFPNSVPMK